MGLPELGVLLGGTVGETSFEKLDGGGAPIGWTADDAGVVPLGSYSFVHSSYTGVNVSFAGGSKGFYRYGTTPLDYRLSPDVATHGLVVRGWAAPGAVADSGYLSVSYNDTVLAVGAVLPYAGFGAGGSLAPFRLEMVTRSTGFANFVAFTSSLNDTTSRTLYMDDVLIYADVLRPPLPPEYKRNTALAMQSYLTQGGKYAEKVWGAQRAWSWTWPAAPNSVCDLINRWWELGLPLVFVEDSSLAETTAIAFLTGPRPAMLAHTPYDDRADITINLMAAKGGLAW